MKKRPSGTPAHASNRTPLLPSWLDWPLFIAAVLAVGVSIYCLTPVIAKAVVCGGIGQECVIGPMDQLIDGPLPR